MTDDIKELQEVFLAKWTYEQLSLLKDQTLGPALRMHPYSFGVYDVIKEGLEKIIGKEREENTSQIIKVASPWHAALILESLQHHLQLKQSRVIFRGQFDSKWKIEPTINRERFTEFDRENEYFKSKLFCDILSSMSFNTLSFLSPKASVYNLKIPSDSYLAAAQHYGIATNLIDYTPDPAVAVYFAANDALDRKDRTASVFAIPLEEAFENGCEIIIPPPFIERLHIQRGFFIKQSDPKSEVDFKKIALFEIQFPCDFDFQPYDVVRRGKGKVDLLPKNEAIENVLTIVKKASTENAIKKLSDNEFKKLVEDSAYKLKQDFMHIYKDPIRMWAEYVDAFEDMLYWTCYYSDEKNLYMDETTLARIGDSNKELVLSIAQFYRYMVRAVKTDWTEERKNFLLGLAAILEQPFYNRGELKLDDL
jgi:hypothetical protein